MRQSSILFLILMVGLNFIEGKWWMQQPYEDDSFNHREEYEKNETLECRDDRITDKPFEFRYWIRPDLETMHRGEEEYFKTLDGPAGWIVDQDSGDMVIVLVQERHFGFYHCVVWVANDARFHVVKKGLNYKGSYWGNLWYKYELNTIIGLSAAGGFLLIAIVLIVLNEKCCRDDENLDEMQVLTEYTNAAYAAEEGIEQDKTPPAYNDIHQEKKLEAEYEEIHSEDLVTEL